jgi:glycosyltransferase involved in cell wall biosynthesis
MTGPKSTATARPFSIAYALESSEMSGGVRVVMLQAEHLARRGHKVSVASPAAAPDWLPRPPRVAWERTGLSESEALATADVAVATFWTTLVPVVARARGVVFHLCQGFEGELEAYRNRWEEIEAAYRLPARRLAVSAALGARLERRGLGPVTVVGQAFDPAGFAPTPQHGAGNGNGDPWGLVVGPFESHSKGVDVALEGLARWRARGGRFRLRRISQLPPSEAERRLLPADEFHHALPPGRMPFAYRASDFFVAASTPEEGFGLPSLEALSCGVPSLFSDTPGQREIGGDAAGYFAAGDPEALARELPGIVTEASRLRARERGPLRAASFKPEDVARRLEEAFADAVA